MNIKILPFILFFFLTSFNTYSQSKATKSKVSSNPYYKFELKDTNESITYYLSEFDKDTNLPLVIYIQGSGYNSLFQKQGAEIVPKSGHINLTYSAKGKAKVLLIEKPGVTFLDNFSSNQINKEFDKKFSLHSWSNRIVKVIKYVLNSEKIDTSKIMLIGHSEGGLVAAKVANIMKEKISNVAILAGEGPSQLYSLYKFAEDGTFFNSDRHNMPTSKQRIEYLTNTWKDILAHPNSTDKKFWGFTYLRWASMLKTSVIDELIDYNGKILLVHGLADKAVHPETATIAYTTLLSKEKNIKLKLIEDADHSFNILNKPNVNGWKTVLENALDWFNK